MGCGGGAPTGVEEQSLGQIVGLLLNYFVRSRHMVYCRSWRTWSRICASSVSSDRVLRSDVRV